MKTFLALIGLGFLFTALANADESADKFQTVKARSIELKVPVSWQQQRTKKSTRAAQFTIPAEPSDAQLVVFYFGGPTGGVKLNVERWVGQFPKDDLKLNMYRGKCDAGSYILVDTQGTWNRPDGPPFARKTVSTPNSRVLNVILIEEKDGGKDYYFLKLSGHQDAVAGQVDHLRNAIGADPDSEKEFDLKDAS